MKIEKITLKEIEIREVGGEFERVFYNEKTYPIFLTNYSLKKGKEMGYIETSLFNELAQMSGLQNATNEDGEMDLEALKDFDEEKALQVIYLALVGANKSLDLSYEDFLTKYHYGLYETFELYANLISNLISSDPNQFAKEFERVTDKSNKKN